MRDNLRAQQLIPSQEPYSAAGYQFVLGGNEQLQPASLQQTGDNAIVDWIIVEMRDAADAAKVVFSRSALLQRDGDIVDLDGQSQLAFPALAAGNYFVAVQHRNHLGVISAQPVAFGQGVLGIDFSDPATQVMGGINSRCLHTSGSQSTCLLFGGDADGNGNIQNTDNVLYWMPSVGTSGYKSADYNLDGQVQNSDAVYQWMRNVGRGSAIPR
jgi:hypothetical protein